MIRPKIQLRTSILRRWSRTTMATLTPAGEALANKLGESHGISRATALIMLEAVQRGNGRMAQFNAPELGGMGQWMLGGMTMVGDMFNHTLKTKVDKICSEISTAVLGGGVLVEPGPIGSGSHQNWWPEALGNPSSSGAQNDTAYAIFREAKRLAIRQAGKVSVYDTGDHVIGGVGQQQGGGEAMNFTSQLGRVRVGDLREVSR